MLVPLAKGRSGSRRVLVACLLSLLLVVTGACAAGLNDPDGRSSDDGEAGGASAAGKAAYVARCRPCHGQDGSGSPVGPQIKNPVVDYSFYVVRQGRDEMGFQSGMPALMADDVPDEQLTSILAWLREAPHPTDGEGLYTRFCANCHGAEGVNGRVDEDIAGEEADEVEERVRKGHGGDDFGARTSYMPAWTTSDISDAEVAAIAAYLTSLDGGDDGDDDDD